MDDGWAWLIILLLRDPHGLESGERSQDRASNPYGVLPLWRSNDFDFHCRWREGGDFLLHSVRNTWEHCRTTGQDGVGIQVLTDIDVTFHNWIVCRLVHSGSLHSNEGRLKERLWAPESLVSNGDDLNEGKFIYIKLHKRHELIISHQRHLASNSQNPVYELKSNIRKFAKAWMTFNKKYFVSFLFYNSNIYVHFFKPGKHIWKQIRMTPQWNMDLNRALIAPFAPFRKGQGKQLSLCPLAPLPPWPLAPSSGITAGNIFCQCNTVSDW